MVRWQGGQLSPPQDDWLAAEEPLELRLLAPARPLALLMRTPGADRELLRGWLHAEGAPLTDEDALQSHPENPNLWFLQAEVGADFAPRQVSSACGLCGSGSVERLLLDAPPLPSLPPLAAALLARLPDDLRAGQAGFGLSGSLHGAALYSGAGERLCLFEDIGRHNAANKVVGWALAQPELARAECILAVSSRLGYEIVQKAQLAGIGAVVGVGGASSLAAQGAAATGLLLAGFARGGRLTIYAGQERLQL